MIKVNVFIWENYTLRLWHSVRKSMAEAVDELDDLDGAPMSDIMTDLSEPGFWEWTATILRVGAPVKQKGRKEEARLMKAIGDRRRGNRFKGAQYVEVLTAIL